ncbi:MAG TPA: SMI1/KNR4 family protein [Polyangiaceae bacterium]|nr:SMI1/KNR4 family protein [Polyangiaceae bacterium]
MRSLHQKLRIPRRYRDFLTECDPHAVEMITPAERIQLIPATELEQAQIGFSLTADGSLISAHSPAGWRPAWVIVATSALLGDPYFLDTSKPDAEGDCPVYTAMSGTEVWQPRLCASTFALFLKILAVGMEVAGGFDLNDYDVDNEQVFREALGPKIREHDPAALKAGHWT